MVSIVLLQNDPYLFCCNDLELFKRAYPIGGSRDHYETMKENGVLSFRANRDKCKGLQKQTQRWILDILQSISRNKHAIVKKHCWSDRLFPLWYLFILTVFIYASVVLEQRQYKNDSTESRCMLILKLPPFFPHHIGEWKRAAISKQTFIWTLSSRSYIILALIKYYY